MSKTKSVWSCRECGGTQTKWAGQCQVCSKWNTLEEEIDFHVGKAKFESLENTHSKPVKLHEIAHIPTPRIQTGIGEFDRLIGGGIVPGSLTLVGGEPGIGKSTLLLQLTDALGNQGCKILYICAEESVQQTSLRAKRLGIKTDNLYLYSESNFSKIKAQVDKIEPHILIVDSIQIVYKSDVPSSPGSVTQVRECTCEFMHLAKTQNIATLLVGHVTKSGEIAGPKILEHLVDSVLYFEGDRQLNIRLIRVVKNRFGPTDEVAVFEMKNEGLVEVENPSSAFLEPIHKDPTGSIVIPTLEGSRPILVEVQALVTDTGFSTPTRRCTGIDKNRLALLLAVIEKRVKYPLHQCDVFVSVAGGITVQEPAADLGILLTIASSFRNKPLDIKTTAIGEIGLGGEIRKVPRLDTRLKEVIHMGFQRILVPSFYKDNIPSSIKEKITIEPVGVVEQAIDLMF